jgi:hypothetical protein
MRRVGLKGATLIAAVVVLAGVVVAALAGLIQTGADSPSGAAKRAGGEGKVVATRDYYEVKGPWLVWDKASCGFKPTTEHPDEYQGQLRSGNNLRVVYTTAETTLPPSKQINASFDKYSKLAKLDMQVFNNEFPSKTRPLQIAQQAAAVKPDVVVSSVWIPELYGQITKTYKQACVPFINMFNIAPLDKIPGFQSGFPASGEALAKGVIDSVKKRAWPAEDTWMVICGQPLTGNRPGTDVDVITTFRPLVQKALDIPAKQTSPILDCTDPKTARTTITDWLTAHPQAKYVIGMAIADTVAIALTQALEDKGYTAETAISAGGQANDPALEVMAKPDAIFQANFDKDFPDWGIIGLSMAQDIAAGRPVPYFVDPGVTPVIGATAAKQLLEARKSAAGGE